VEANSYISKFMILSLDWKETCHLYIGEGPVLRPLGVLRWGASKYKLASRLGRLLYNFFEKLELEVIKKKKEMTNACKMQPTPKY
jgi:hypothetical protein